MSDEIESLRERLAAAGVPDDTLPSFSLGRAETIDAGVSTPADGGALPEARIDDTDAARFRVIGSLGRGGLAEVFLAEDRVLDREVALKRVHDERAGAQRALLEEARITGRLEHPAIVPIHGIVTDRDGPAVVMKRVAGRTWQSLIEGEDIRLERHLEIFERVCQAVAYAHERGIVHRDIKPENIMTGDFGEVYLMDWGLARTLPLEGAGPLAGTPHFMAPEMVEGRADERTDVYLLGATLHAVLTGKPRHDGSDIVGALYLAAKSQPYAYGNDVADELARICNRACEADPAARYQHASELVHAVQTYRRHLGANILSDTAHERFSRLDALLESASPDYAEVQSVWNEARFAFEQSLLAWPENPAAREGLTDCIVTMAEYELSLGHHDLAGALLETAPERDEDLEERVHLARQEAEDAKARLSSLELDADLGVGAAARRGAYRAGAAAIIVLTIVAAALRFGDDAALPSPTRLAIIGGIVLSIAALIADRWRRRGWNAANRRIAQVVLATLAVSFVQRLVAALASISSAQVLGTDAYILALGTVGLWPYHRWGQWLSAVAGSLGVVGAFWPERVDELFMAASVSLPLVFLIAGRERRIGGSERPADASS